MFIQSGLSRNVRNLADWSITSCMVSLFNMNKMFGGILDLSRVVKNHNNDNSWASMMAFKVPITRLFVQQLPAHTRRNSVSITDSIWWESTDDRWVPFTHGQWCEKRVNVMASSWYHDQPDVDPEISLHSHLDSNTVIATKFYTWYGSCAVVACANICCDLMASNGAMTRPSFLRIWIAGKNRLWNGPK